MGCKTKVEEKYRVDENWNQKNEIRKFRRIQNEFRKFEIYKIEIYENHNLGVQKPGGKIYGTAFKTQILKIKTYLKRI